MEKVCIKVVYVTCDRYRKVRTFKTLAGARKFAHEKIGEHPDIGMGYAVGMYGDAKIMVGGCTLAELFPEREEAPRAKWDCCGEDEECYGRCDGCREREAAHRKADAEIRARMTGPEYKAAMVLIEAFAVIVTGEKDIPF